MRSALQDVADALRAEGGLLAAVVRDAPPGRPPAVPGHLAFVWEAVREGYLVHHGAGRIVDGGDPDLALLAGDRLYALGLERLARAGDLASVRALADLIGLGAQARAQGDPDLAEAVWEAGTAELALGLTPELARAKERARSGAPGAADALRAAARLAASTRAPAKVSDG